MPPKSPVMAKKTPAKPMAKKKPIARPVNPAIPRPSTADSVSRVAFEAQKKMKILPVRPVPPKKELMKKLPKKDLNRIMPVVPGKSGGKPATKPMFSRRSGF